MLHTVDHIHIDRRQKLDNATNFAGITGTYNSLNQINTFNGTSYTYDNNGNLTSDGTRTYTYDAADRLLTVTQGSAVTTYGYDGLGRRVKRTYVNGTTTNTRYLWCGIAICQTRDGSDTVTAKLFAEGEYRPSGTKKYLYLTDHLGSVRDVVDITGTPTLVAAFDYRPYGAIARSYGSVVPLYQYAMLVADPNTGLLLSTTRPYNPANGKWLSADPIREAGGVNLTGYVGAGPVGFSDVLGLARTWMDLGQGYTAGLDVFNGPGGAASFEIHVFDPTKNEIGVVGPEGWINKHGFRGPPPNLPGCIKNTIRGIAIERMRLAGLIPRGISVKRIGPFLSFLAFIDYMMLANWAKEMGISPAELMDLVAGGDPFVHSVEY